MPWTSALQAAIGTKVTLVARLRPSWTEGESFVFGVMGDDPETTALSSQAFMLDVNCFRDPVTGNVVNTYGASERVYVGGVSTPSGGAASGVTPGAAVVEFAVTWEIDTATRYRRLHTRYAPGDPWTTVASMTDSGAATGWSYEAATYGGTGIIAYAGNRYQVAAPNWRGALMSLSIRAGITGSGASATPGGTELAEWHADPPDSTYADAYGNTWTVNGPDWSWTSID